MEKIKARVVNNDFSEQKSIPIGASCYILQFEEGMCYVAYENEIHRIPIFEIETL